ncbi:MAG UNVERIFIED_CONTAM: hypothetical protein LVR29_12695 [Microcystis novacekii LVE1205-3]|jgi:cytochrome c-type biogenesis protein CcmH/NrfG
MWHPDAYQALIAEDYPQVAAIYEELIDNNPENVSDYWYLGVAYLLQNLEAEAQVMWQSILSEGNPEEVKAMASRIRSGFRRRSANDNKEKVIRQLKNIFAIIYRKLFPSQLIIY